MTSAFVFGPLGGAGALSLDSSAAAARPVGRARKPKVMRWAVRPTPAFERTRGKRSSSSVYPWPRAAQLER
jgi:hypothetical protein